MNQAETENERERLARILPFLKQRAAMMRGIREFFFREGFLEVETPARITSPAPEAHIDPEPSGDRFLIASPELQMKRLLAAPGCDRIYQVCKCFRRGERGRLHSPEFTMLEWYRKGGDAEDLMKDCERLIRFSREAIRKERETTPKPLPELDEPWHRITVKDAFERYAGWTPGPEPDPRRFDMDLVEKVEPALPRDLPVFLCDYPASMASLAKLSPTDPAVAKRFELYGDGLELANGFEELTDPSEQRRRFEQEEERRAKRGLAPYSGFDEIFLDALEVLPDCAGIAMGLDRLAMYLTGAEKIDHVTCFTFENT